MNGNYCRSLNGSERRPATIVSNKQTIVPDGGATWSDLTGFQRDCLEAIARIEAEGEIPIGLKILGELETRSSRPVTHGQIYPNLDTLSEYAFVEKSEIDGRTNSYELTDLAGRMLEQHVHQAADAVGMVVVDRELAVTDGGR